MAKPKPIQKQRTVRVDILLTQKEYDIIRRRAELLGLKPSQYIRSAGYTKAVEESHASHH